MANLYPRWEPWRPERVFESPVEHEPVAAGISKEVQRGRVGWVGRCARHLLRVATPLLLVLLVIELSDIVFATDSVPAAQGGGRRIAFKIRQGSFTESTPIFFNSDTATCWERVWW